MALELSSRSEDFREGLAAFQDKRDARFQGAMTQLPITQTTRSARCGRGRRVLGHD